MNPKDEEIIRHIARYHVGLNPVFMRLIFDGDEFACRNSVRRLVNSMRLKAVEGLNRYSYYLLSDKETKRLGLPKDRSTPKDQSLMRWISVAWFCCMGETRRHALIDRELKEFFGERKFNVPYCIEKSAAPCIYRIHTPAEDASA